MAIFTLSKISRIITLIKFPTLNLYMKNFIVFHPNIKTVITNIFLRVSEILGSFWPLPAEVLKGLVNYHWIDGYCNGYLVINGDLRVLGPLAFIQAVFLHHNSKVKLFNKICHSHNFTDLLNNSLNELYILNRM